jgi:glycosyltransferase involved in cell wall biosynthesis
LRADISVIVPVRNNSAGICRLLAALERNVQDVAELAEVIVIDDGSRDRPSVPASVGHVPVRLQRTLPRGPAHARNTGAALARGRWLLFTDSDCEPLGNWIHGFSSALNGSIAYAGHVRARGSDRLSRYYDSQKILIPPPGREGYPAYVVTANALVWRETFDAIGGFNDAFRLAAGEDIDLGLRLWRVGDISYAPQSIVQHDFEPSFSAFFRRFVRYGRGNRSLAEHYSASLWPRPFLPAAPSAFNLIASLGQLAAMTVGYIAGGRHKT